jgi:hypothetical protein
MSRPSDPRRVAGRQRRHPSNAARQAAYRKRVLQRQRALAAAAGGRFHDAVDRIDALADKRVAQATADRDRLRAERDRLEREARAARRAIQAVTARAEAAERRVARLAARLELVRSGGDGTPRGRSTNSAKVGTRGREEHHAAPGNRAQRRAQQKRRGRTR